MIKTCLNLPLHSQEEKYEEVHDEYGPEDWYVETFEECRENRYQCGYNSLFPEKEGNIENVSTAYIC